MNASEGDIDAEELLWAFSRNYAKGDAGDPLDLLARIPESQKSSFAIDLLRACVELRRFDLSWLKETFNDARLNVDRDVYFDILRGVYSDMTTLGVSAALNAFDVFSYEADDLRLQADDDSFYLGEVITGQIRIVERLGAGGVSVVYRGESLVDGANYAVRVARKMASDVEAKTKHLIRNECLLMQSLSIDGIPRIYELVESSVGPVGIVELIRGKSPSCGPRHISETNALRIASEVGRIVDELHRHGHIHGDIKPANVLITENGKVYLNDLNISRSANASHHSDGKAMGTLGKMSPESLVGVAADVDIRDDIYALGAFLYELLEGRGLTRPASREEAIIMSILVGGVHETEYSTTSSELTKLIIKSATSRHPDKRFETAKDFSDACIVAAEDNRVAVEIPQRNQLLAAWRLGNNLGLFATRLAIVKRSMIEAAQNVDQSKLGSEFHYGLGHAIGVSLALEDAIRNASYLSIEMIEPEFSKSFSDHFYRKANLNRDAIGEIQKLVTNAEAWFRTCRLLVDDSLRNNKPTEFLLLSLATQTRFVPYADRARQEWASVAVRSGLPVSVCERFTQACLMEEVEVDWEKHLQDFDYRVIRWLRWGLG